MMKLNVLSDLHLDFYNEFKAYEIIDETMNEVDCDYHVIAGDLCEMSNINYFKYINKLEELSSPVIYVFGNHEYYNVTNAKREIFLNVINRYNNIKVLNNNSCKIDNKIFYGGTMWFDESPESIKSSEVYPQVYALSDFNHIHVDFNYYMEENKKFFDNIKDINPEIIVTHHVPHKDMLLINYNRDMYDMNKFYYCDKAFQYIEENHPKLWICGHTHKTNDMMCGNTRIINNSFGYPNENVNVFNNKIVEI